MKVGERGAIARIKGNKGSRINKGNSGRREPIYL